MINNIGRIVYRSPFISAVGRFVGGIRQTSISNVLSVTHNKDYNENTKTGNDGQLVVSKPKSHVTEAVKITGRGFQPNTPHTLHGCLQCVSESLHFQSYAHIQTNEDGEFDLTMTESTWGTYTGTDPMGMFWSMEKIDDSYARVQMNNAATPLKYDFRIYDGHIKDIGYPKNSSQTKTSKDLSLTTDMDKTVNCSTLATVDCVRYFIDETVSRTVIPDGPIRGTLLSPAGDGPFPAIITLDGGNKRKQVVEDAAAILCSQGYVTLALAYFGVEGLPKNYTQSPLRIEYFEGAVEYLRNLPNVNSESIGVYGTSKGADIGFAMMSKLPQVKAMCSVNGCIASIGTQTTYNDHITEMLPGHPNRVEILENGLLNIKNALDSPRDHPNSVHAFEHSMADLLIIAGLDDYNFDSELMADIAVERMQEVGKTNYKMLKYPDLGHFIDAPFMPPCDVFPHPLVPKGMMVYFGGKNKSEHTKHQVESWNEIFEFFRTSLLK